MNEELLWELIRVLKDIGTSLAIIAIGIFVLSFMTCIS